MNSASNNKFLFQLTLTAFVFLVTACTQKENDFKSWSAYRGDAANTAYSSLDQINKENVSQLEVAWTYHTGDAAKGNRSAIQCNPIIANGMMYVTSPKLKLIALEPTTGKELWKFDPFEGKEAPFQKWKYFLFITGSFL